MMRYLKILFLSMVVIGLIAGSAMAQTQSRVADNSGTWIGWEATNLNGFTTSATDGRYIRYNPDVNLGFAQNETITFSLTNGTFRDNLLYVLCGTPITVGAPADMKIGDQIGGGYGFSYITFRFNDSTVVGGTDNYIDISRDGNACGLGTYANLAIKSNAGLAAGAKISAAVTDARTVGNVQIVTALTGGTNVGDLLEVVVQFSFLSSPDGTASNPRMISIADDLKLFVEPPFDRSDSNFNFANGYSANSGNWITSLGGHIRAQSDSASAVFTLTGAPGAVYLVYYDGDPCSLKGANWVCEISSSPVLDILARWNSNADRPINVTVNTIDPIDSASLNATLAVDFTNSNFLDRTYSANNAVWQREGTTLHVQLVKSNLPNYETYIKLQTKSGIPNPPVVAAVLCGDGSVQTGTFGPLVAGTPLVITGSELIGVCGGLVSGTAGFAATLTINAKEVDMFGYANTCYSGEIACKRIPVKTQRGFSEILNSGVVSE